MNLKSDETRCCYSHVEFSETMKIGSNVFIVRLTRKKLLAASLIISKRSACGNKLC